MLPFVVVGTLTRKLQVEWMPVIYTIVFPFSPGPVRQLNASLNKMKDLPDDTMVWPGHELALENLELAVFIEPENIKALLKLVWAFNRREAKFCTCPSTIGESTGELMVPKYKFIYLCCLYIFVF